MPLPDCPICGARPVELTGSGFEPGTQNVVCENIWLGRDGATVRCSMKAYGRDHWIELAARADRHHGTDSASRARQRRFPEFVWIFASGQWVRDPKGYQPAPIRYRRADPHPANAPRQTRTEGD